MKIFLFLLMAYSWDIYSCQREYSITVIYLNGEKVDENDDDFKKAIKSFDKELKAGFSDEDLESVNMIINPQLEEIWLTYYYQDGSGGGEQLNY